MKLFSGIGLRPLNKSEEKQMKAFGESMQSNFKKFRELDRKRREAIAKARTIVLD